MRLTFVMLMPVMKTFFINPMCNQPDFRWIFFGTDHLKADKSFSIIHQMRSVPESLFYFSLLSFFISNLLITVHPIRHLIFNINNFLTAYIAPITNSDIFVLFDL